MVTPEQNVRNRDELFTPTLQCNDERYAQIRLWNTGSLFFVTCTMGVLPGAVLAYMNARWFDKSHVYVRGIAVPTVAGLAATIIAGYVTGRSATAYTTDHVIVGILFGNALLSILSAISICRSQQTMYRTFNFYQMGHYRSLDTLPDAWFILPLFLLGTAQFLMNIDIVFLLLKLK